MLRAAVIGCGFQGRLHIEVLGEIGAEVVGICDADAGRVEDAGNEFGVGNRYTGYEDLLRAQRPDFVSVCTMPNSHRELCTAALSAGAHVLCEKPLALNATEGKEMVAAAKAANRHLLVGFNMRFSDSALGVKQFIEAGELGTPICARGYMLADDVPWWGPHYIREVSGGGALAATAVHMLDLVWWLVGRPRPVTATASMATLFPKKRAGGAPVQAAARRYDTEDIVFGHVRFENEFWMSIEGAWVWDRAGWNYGFDLVGDKAQAHFDPLELVAERAGELVNVTSGRPSGRDFRAALGREIEEVVSSIAAGQVPSRTANADEALVIQALVDALYASAKAGREVKVAVPSV
jgi:predicted dehydrogenase